MNFLLDNPIASIDGTLFLILFIAFIAITLTVLGIARASIDSTNNMPIPAIPPQVDPFEIAYLRGGANELARSVVFALVQKGFVEVTSTDKESRLRRIDTANGVSSLTEIEQRALSWLGIEREAKDVFDASGGLVNLIESQSTRYELGLARRQFLMPNEWKGRMKKYGWAAAITIAAAGFYKIAVAWSNGRSNFLFALFLTIIGFAIARAIGRLPRVTKLGRQYLARLQSAFEGLKYQTAQKQPLTAQSGSAAIDPLLLSVGVFGTGILAGTAFSYYNDSFVKQQQSGGGCGSSCGSGCSSSCGSGDGGGCGGGCGGCS